MQYHFDRIIRFAVENEFKSLYRWSLQEFSASGQALSSKMIPWLWDLYFVGTDMLLAHTVEIRREADGTPISPDEREVVHITLKPDGNEYAETHYSMFGTDRRIVSFNLAVRSADSNVPACTAWGTPSYTTEADVNFPKKTFADACGFYLTVPSQQFATLKHAALHGHGDYTIGFSASGVRGAYAQWSPSIDTQEVKFLVCDSNQQVLDVGSQDLPRLSLVDQSRLSIWRKSKLSPSQR